MALFGPFVLVLSPGDRARLDRIAVALEALVAKVSEAGQSPEDLEGITAGLAAHDTTAAEALRAASASALRAAGGPGA